MALRSQIDPFIKSFGYFMFNDEVFKNLLVFQLKCFVDDGKQSTTTHRHSPNKVDDSQGYWGGGRFQVTFFKHSLSFAEKRTELKCAFDMISFK